MSGKFYYLHLCCAVYSTYLRRRGKGKENPRLRTEQERGGVGQSKARTARTRN